MFLALIAIRRFYFQDNVQQETCALRGRHNAMYQNICSKEMQHLFIDIMDT